MRRLQNNRVFLLLCCVLLLVICYGNASAQAADEAERLWGLGEKALDARQYQQAISYYERSLSMTRKANNLEGIAANLNGLGAAYEAQGDFGKALSYYLEALKIARQINNKDLIATNLFNAGSIYSSDFNQYEKALPFFEESLRIFKELNNKESAAIVLFHTGKALQSLGRYEKALPYFNECLSLNRALGNQQGIAATLDLLGNVYAGLGQFDKPLPLYQEALRINTRLANQKEIALTLRNIGDAYNDLLEYDKALPNYEQALGIQKKQGLQSDLAITLTNLGSLYQALSRYDKALAVYGESLKISKAINNRAGAATALNNIGQTYASLGRSDEALSSYQQSLALEKQLGRLQKTAIVLNNIGMEQFRNGRYEQALANLEKALGINRQLNMVHDVTVRLNNIGAIYLRQKKYREAERTFLERKELQPQVPNIRLIHPGLEELYLIHKKYDKALALLDSQGRKPTWRSNNTYSLEYYTHYGLALKGLSRYRESAHSLLRAVAISEDMRLQTRKREGFFGGGGYIGRLVPHRTLSAVLAEQALQGERPDERFLAYGKDLASEAFYFAELTKARTLLETMAAAAKQYDDTDLPAEIRTKGQALRAGLAEIDKDWETAYKQGKAEFSRLQQKKDELKREVDTYITMIRAQYPKYAALNYPQPVPADELPLKEHEVLLEFSLNNDAGYLFVIKKTGVRSIHRINISREELDQKVRDFMRPLNTGDYSGFSVKRAKDLYDLLFSDALADVKDTERLIIVPDGILGLLPFEALVKRAGTGLRDSRYVGDTWRVSYVQSASALALTRVLHLREATKQLFALGNPVYNADDPRYLAYKAGKSQEGTVPKDLARYAYRGVTVVAKNTQMGTGNQEWEEVVYPPLPETEEEVREIAALFNTKPEPPDVLLNVQASETNFRKVNLGDYRYIHLATHADMPGKVRGMTEPFVILGQVENRNGDDGFLTLTEALGLRLNADMVVLSACSTGKGALMEGEGVANFARAFQYAGARSVVVSLWEVASRPAVEYMKLFYGHLKAGKERGEALRLARNEIKLKYPSPFFWAVFILHGDG
jgi:CHAT domain-containing protein/Flp pilus assembly protein TadD